jgi:hypothetical protein
MIPSVSCRQLPVGRKIQKRSRNQVCVWKSERAMKGKHLCCKIHQTNDGQWDGISVVREHAARDPTRGSMDARRLCGGELLPKAGQRLPHPRRASWLHLHNSSHLESFLSQLFRNP